jgi:hypothetical protein
MVSLRYTCHQEIDALINKLTKAEQSDRKELRRLALETCKNATRAIELNSCHVLVVAAALVRPCVWHIAGTRPHRVWTKHEFMVSGTFQWIEKEFSTDVAELVRLLSEARRYLASVSPKYICGMSYETQHAFFEDGGYLGGHEIARLKTNRLFHKSLELLSWCDTRWNRSEEYCSWDSLRTHLVDAKLRRSEILHDPRPFMAFS